MEKRVHQISNINGPYASGGEAGNVKTIVGQSAQSCRFMDTLWSTSLTSPPTHARDGAHAPSGCDTILTALRCNLPALSAHEGVPFASQSAFPQLAADEMENREL